MKTAKITFILISLFVMGNITDANAQKWLESLGKRAENAAKRRVERKVEDKVDKAIDDTFDKTEESIKKKNEKKNAADNNNGNAAINTPEQKALRQSASTWDDGEPYYMLKKGTKIQYTDYDKKGKVQGYNNQTIIEFSRKGRSVTATVSGTQTDAKGESLGSATVRLRANNGNFYVDVLSILPPKDMEKLDMDVKLTGNDMIIPEKLAPGLILPDAQATFNMKLKAGGESVDMPPIVYRIINRKAEGVEAVETPMGKYICFKITHDVEVDLPIIGKQRFSGATWIGKGMGAVKSEVYDKKGKLTNRTLLTKLE